jgi:hypothetical protein
MEAETCLRPTGTPTRPVGPVKPTPDLDAALTLASRPGYEAVVTRPLSLAPAAAIIVVLNLIGWGVIGSAAWLLVG